MSCIVSQQWMEEMKKNDNPICFFISVICYNHVIIVLKKDYRRNS